MKTTSMLQVYAYVDSIETISATRDGTGAALSLGTMATKTTSSRGHRSTRL